MILKSHRLSNAFEHYFIPNSSKLLSPKSIKIEVWDLGTREIETKFHPKLFCINSIAISTDGLIFVCRGGCTAAISEFKVYNATTLESFIDFSITEEACNPIFSADNKSIYFGTWQGNFYKYNISSNKLERMFKIDNSMIPVLAAEHGHEKFALVVSPIVRKGENWPDHDYVLLYEVGKNGKQVIQVPQTHADTITGIAVSKNYLSCMVYKGSSFEMGRNFQYASLYIFDLYTKKIVHEKANFKVPFVHSKISPMSWNNDEQLALIGFQEAYLIDAKKDFNERIIPVGGSRSIAFSNCGNAVAIGGDKAMLYKL